MTVKMYVDGIGVNISTEHTLSSSIVSSANAVIGAFLDNSSPKEVFDGKIDEVRIWNDARSANEIADNMNCPLNGDEENLVGYWDLEEGTGTTAEDKAGDADGTMSNATWSTDAGMDCSSNVNELASNSTLALYPNPSSSSTSLQSDVPLQNASIKIYDLQGLLVQDLDDINGLEVRIETSELQAGTYLIFIEEPGEAVRAIKLLIQ